MLLLICYKVIGAGRSALILGLAELAHSIVCKSIENADDESRTGVTP